MYLAFFRQFIRELDFREKDVDEALRILMSRFRTPVSPFAKNRYFYCNQLFNKRNKFLTIKIDNFIAISCLLGTAIFWL